MVFGMRDGIVRGRRHYRRRFRRYRWYHRNKPPREEGEGSPRGWYSRGKWRGY